MDIMLVGGASPLMKKLSLKLHKEGHRIFVLSGSRDPQNHYEHVFERYDFSYDKASVEEVFRSVNPDVTILMGAYDSNYPGRDFRREAVAYSAGLQNLLLSWSALKKGRLIYLSSVEVYGGKYPSAVSEQDKPRPRGVRPRMLYQGEESCRFYQEELSMDVVILRLDWLHDVCCSTKEALSSICGRKCLDAFRDGSVSYQRNYAYALTYIGDAVESIYKVVACEEHQEALYHISSSEAYSEHDIVKKVGEVLGKKIEQIDNIVGEQHQIILSNERFKAEFGFKVWCRPEETIEKTLQYMKQHSNKFLDADHPGMDIWHKLYYAMTSTLGALVPYLENLILFIPFFVINNRATDSQYFSKIDFYLLYVLLFAVIYGQRQATFSGILATAGYLFRQMYTRSGLAVVTDYNTYVWIAEIFIVGLVVGYMKDSLLFLKEEKEWEVGFLSEQVTDIGDINDSNLRVKEGLIDQVINYDNSLGTVYDATEQLEQKQSVEIFFCALNMIQKLMDCPDVAIYRVNKEKYARLFAYSSAKAASMGNTVYLPDKKSLDEACNENRVYINRSMEKEYPMMAYNVESEEQMEILIMLWSLPFERMTINEANRLIVIGKLIQTSVRRADRYLEALSEERYHSESQILKASAFEELVGAYRKASKEKLTEYVLLQIEVEGENEKETVDKFTSMLRESDYIGNLSDGKLYLLLTNTDLKGCSFVQNKLKQNGVASSISEEGRL